MLVFFFSCYGDHRDLHSFPTRRSSDLTRSAARPRRFRRARPPCWRRSCPILSGAAPAILAPGYAASKRSEEHTSELQSHSDLVCRLLLEKKKQKKKRARQAKEPHQTKL